MGDEGEDDVTQQVKIVKFKGRSIFIGEINYSLFFSHAVFVFVFHTLCCRCALPTFVLNALLPISRVCLFTSVYPLVVDVDRFREEVYGGLSGVEAIRARIHLNFLNM